MKTKVPGLALLVAFVLCLPGTGRTQNQQDQAQAQNIRAYVELLRSDLRDNKRNVIAAVMQFSDEDAVKFWPIYNQYESELEKLGNRRLKLLDDYIAHYNNLTNAVAEDLVQRSLELEAQRNMLKRKYYEKFSAALSPVTAGRFYQVENQIQLLLDLQIASRLPIAGKPQVEK